MAVGESGKAVATTVPGRKPGPFAPRVAKHIHRGPMKPTWGGPGATMAPGANLAGSTGTAPYGTK